MERSLNMKICGAFDAFVPENKCSRWGGLSSWDLSVDVDDEKLPNYRLSLEESFDETYVQKK